MVNQVIYLTILAPKLYTTSVIPETKRERQENIEKKDWTPGE